MMPERLVESSGVVGGLSARWAGKLGLAAGVTQAGHHVAMIGTSMCWGYLNQSVDANHGLVSMPHVYNGRRVRCVVPRSVLPGRD